MKRALLVILFLAIRLSAQDQTSVAVEALSRLKGIDLEANPQVKAAVLKVLGKTKGTPQFIQIVDEFKLQGESEGLLEAALKNPDDPQSPAAIRIILGENKPDLLEKSMNGPQAAALVKLLSKSNEPKARPLLESAAVSTKVPAETRDEAIRALAQSLEGSRSLLALLQARKLNAAAAGTTAQALQRSTFPEIKSEAQKLESPSTAKSLPPISELVKMSGESARGEAVFMNPNIGCVNCHQVRGKGIDFGPNLSAIGSKLGKDALYQAILEPSAGILFGYEGYILKIGEDDEVSGIIAGETADEVTLKTQNGQLTKYRKADIKGRQKMANSIMPNGLADAMSVQDLADLVEFLSSLKAPAPSNP